MTNICKFPTVPRFLFFQEWSKLNFRLRLALNIQAVIALARAFSALCVQLDCQTSEYKGRQRILLRCRLLLRRVEELNCQMQLFREVLEREKKRKKIGLLATAYDGGGASIAVLPITDSKVSPIPSLRSFPP